MRRLADIAIAVAALAAVAIAAAAQSPTIRVIDGDTVSVAGHSVRLVGLNAPDGGLTGACAAEKALAPRATSRLRQIVAAGNVDVRQVPCSCKPGTEGTQACNFGRSCGVMTANGVDVATILIGEGLAARFVCGATSCPRLPHPWCAEGKP